MPVTDDMRGWLVGAYRIHSNVHIIGETMQIRGHDIRTQAVQAHTVRYADDRYMMFVSKESIR